ncbi:Mini-ribonuclease 3 [Fructilactobacillus fructivorans]|uniref:Mini-ribonuclease 3 n=1 Tax=Fructilactobacillus fructivorans TaxID=1614 RepID=A0A0C1Q1N0_9LACO|nr:Mini-ribonuclease 3 [Fructilactobacillus fructivorans]KID41718.1 Ribonuclease III family protein [Fructilactobacillus fructivorans]MCT0151371.1 Mini-ribonuclease 3 [Fructilactobacillus fructivorans]MCT2867552.1 Mini-ribonuclease 3 [Fructilactobacillus fructivorans]MCT2868930.1 Mini-ribonuclease 3 [Fructilactobacillus fructivorans]MCT2873900.1 Mini-ribonuclease 3 [Fructilactobacillus fructivorans]
MSEADDNIQYRQLNGIVLAYLGDAVYEVYIRRHLIDEGIARPNQLQRFATKYVSAKAQAGLIDLMKQDGILSDEEAYFFKRGRNAKSYTHAKNTSVVTYRISTGFEALFGFLSLSGQDKRLDELAKWCIDQVDAGRVEYER